jgi:hypothetical protein
MKVETITEDKLFPPQPLFWALVHEERRMSRAKFDKWNRRWYLLGYKWGWEDNAWQRIKEEI